MSLEIFGTFNFTIAFQVEHKILMHPSHMLGVAGVFSGSYLVLCMVPDNFWFDQESTKNESTNEDYKFGQGEKHIIS